MIHEFEPSNPLEIALQKTMIGKASMDTFLKVFVQSELYLPSTTKLDKDLSNFSPIVFDKDGTPMAAVFTNVKLMDLYKTYSKGNLAINGAVLLTKSAAGFGIVINPGYTLGLELGEHGIKNIVDNIINKL